MYCTRKRTRINQAQDASLQQSQTVAAISETAPFLSEDIIVNILKRVPAEFWGDSIRCVCKGWAAIPRDPQFIKSHLLHAKPLLYIQETISSDYAASFYTMEEKKSNLAYKRSPFPGQICDSIDGILLLHELPMAFHVMNPNTMQVKKLPPIPKLVCPKFYEGLCQIAWNIKCAKIARAQNGKLKVICAAPVGAGASFCFHGLTLDGNESSWTFCAQLKIQYNQLGKSVCIGGVTYWSFISVYGKALAIDLNDETAVIRYFLLPKELGGIRKGDEINWEFVKIGNHLGVTCWNLEAGEVKSWVMEDLQQQAWVKLSCIELSKVGIRRGDIILSVNFLIDQYLEAVIFQVFCKPDVQILAFNSRLGKVRTVSFRKAAVPMGKAIGTHINSFVPF